MRHELDCAPDMWMALRSGEKTAEFRRNTRAYEIGDELAIYLTTKELVPDSALIFKITHIVRGPLFNIPEGYAMLSLRALYFGG